MRISRRLPCIKISLIQVIFNKLSKRCILKLAAIPRHEVLQVSLRSNSNFESSFDLNNFTAISTRTNFSHIITFQVASYLACFLTNGDYIRYLQEKLTLENKVIAAMRKEPVLELHRKQPVTTGGTPVRTGGGHFGRSVTT